METYSTMIRDIPADERPRERLAHAGAEALSVPELLAIILRVGSSRGSAISLGNQLLKHFGSLRAVATATVAELSAVPGVGMAKAAQIKAAFELGKRLATITNEKPVVNCPEVAAGLVMEDMRYQDKEHFKALLLDVRNRCIAVRPVSMGSLTSNVAHPREVFHEAVSHSAHSVIVAHNHPSGDPTPSEEDKALTRRLVEAGKVMGIEVLDHVIIGDGRWVSLKEKGLM
ncbi:MAG: DNA repair protein RadC [Armatimonadota bacterium]|nr:MAG: DNA repair protein RadC [Armatimonadota bacterium]